MQEQSQPATGEMLMAPLLSNAPTSSAASQSDTSISSSPCYLTHLLYLYHWTFLFLCLLPHRTLPLPWLPHRWILLLLYQSWIGQQTRRTRCVTHWFNLSPLISQPCIADDRSDYPVSTSNQPLQGESNFGDSSELLFSIYSKAAQDEDNKMVERWEKDADGILIFVSPYVHTCPFLHINWNTVDWSILCCSCCPPHHDCPGSEAKQSGYLRILPWKHLSGSRWPKCNSLIHSFSCRQATLILSFEICCLGEFSLILKPGHEPQLCVVGNIVTSMGTSIFLSVSAFPVQSRKLSTNASILCRGHGQYAHSLGRWRTANATSSLTVPFLWQAGHFSV